VASDVFQLTFRTTHLDHLCALTCVMDSNHSSARACVIHHTDNHLTIVCSLVLLRNHQYQVSFAVLSAFHCGDCTDRFRWVAIAHSPYTEPIDLTPSPPVKYRALSDLLDSPTHVSPACRRHGEFRQFQGQRNLEHAQLVGHVGPGCHKTNRVYSIDAAAQPSHHVAICYIANSILYGLLWGCAPYLVSCL